jgi:hypothetical protein
MELLIPLALVLRVTGTLAPKIVPKVLAAIGVNTKTVYRISRSVIRDNIVLDVRARPGDADTEWRICTYYLGPLLERLRLHAADPVNHRMPRLVISCESTTMVNAIFHHLRDELGVLASLPPGG